MTNASPVPAAAGADRGRIDEATQMAELFAMLADPTRARLLCALADVQELSVHDLAEQVPVTDTAVSHALRLLRAAKIVRSRRDGRHVYYRLDDAHVRLLLQMSLEHVRERADAPSTAARRSGR